MPKLTDSEIVERIKVGANFTKRFARNDRDASQKFRDASNVPGYIALDDDYNAIDGGDVPQDLPLGQNNQLATNVITKVASIAIGNPDWHVKTMPANADQSNIVREFLRSKWKLFAWVRLSQMVLMKRYVGGLGILAYRWDAGDKGRPGLRSVFEHVQSWDLAVDPNVQDWQNVKWAARRIKMSVREARVRYPEATFAETSTGTAAADTSKVELWLYFDQDVECHVWNDDVIESEKNLYQRVPFLFMEGDLDPGTSVWPLSDFILAAGLQGELSDLNLIVSNRAKHGGPINLVDSKRMGKAGMEALENGLEQGYLPVDDLQNPPIHRVEGEELSATLMEAKREAQQALDGITGVNQFQRGVLSQEAKFATEVAALSNQSGARGIQARIEYEAFVNKMAETVILMEVAFGGPDEQNPEQHTDEQMILWEALQAVTDVAVLEASTTYKDPSIELQQAMQLVQMMAGLFPLFAQTGQPVPNLKQFVDDVLRAAGKYDMTRYWLPPMPPALPPGAAPAGGPGGADPGAGAMPVPA